jgi:hypothetical protein
MVGGMAIQFIAGCSNSAPGRAKTVPVSGSVTYKGQPVEGAQVTFLGDGNVLPAIAVTDANGKFKCTTYNSGDGAIPGEHSVTVSKTVTTGLETESITQRSEKGMERAMLRGQRGENQPPKPLNMVPEKYAQAATSPLHLTVKEGAANEFKIELMD